jgi:hypothetical protein
MMRSGLLLVACIAMWVFSIQPCFSMEENRLAVESKDPMPFASTADLSNREGQVVWLEGTFQGWQVSGCRFPEGAASKGRTRSDWLIRLGSDCYYVTGGFPAGLNAFDPAHIGVRILLEACPLRDEGGKLYLEYRSSKRFH